METSRYKSCNVESLCIIWKDLLEMIWKDNPRTMVSLSTTSDIKIYSAQYCHPRLQGMGPIYFATFVYQICLFLWYQNPYWTSIQPNLNLNWIGFDIRMTLETTPIYQGNSTVNFKKNYKLFDNIYIGLFILTNTQRKKQI